ncbi:hypothetical protein NC99_17230 [Sunxiuqinia dokdonensis]|uniref:Uncharacterized protein n=1 Tax=Sunxiuqinia dokdonensis TaxID=1409788 RepID=A0A0L8VAT2_9BACT|nr:hypothetical protein NC99_17230 [Sunxiuqinia dokdonensis]
MKPTTYTKVKAARKNGKATRTNTKESMSTCEGAATPRKPLGKICSQQSSSTRLANPF